MASDVDNLPSAGMGKDGYAVDDTLLSTILAANEDRVWREAIEAAVSVVVMAPIAPATKDGIVRALRELQPRAIL